MMNFLYFLFLAASFTFALPSCQVADDDTAVYFPDAPSNPDKFLLLKMLNEARAAGGKCGQTNYAPAPALTWNDTLAQVARDHSQDMNANNRLSHRGANGSFVEDRIESAGYVWSFYAENLLKGGSTEAEAIRIWLESEGHCANIHNPNLKEVGVGTSGPYWTMVLASH